MKTTPSFLCSNGDLTCYQRFATVSSTISFLMERDQPMNKMNTSILAITFATALSLTGCAASDDVAIDSAPSSVSEITASPSHDESPSTASVTAVGNTAYEPMMCPSSILNGGLVMESKEPDAQPVMAEIRGNNAVIANNGQRTFGADQNVDVILQADPEACFVVAEDLKVSQSPDASETIVSLEDASDDVLSHNHGNSVIYLVNDENAVMLNK